MNERITFAQNGESRIESDSVLELSLADVNPLHH
jgi:hypothetical protein